MITTFTRVATDDLDALIDDEELVLALIHEFGFDSSLVQNIANNPDKADPEALFLALDARWNGNGQVYSIEDQIELLEHIVDQIEGEHDLLAKLSMAGKQTHITNECGAIRVLFPFQIKTINDSLKKLPVELLQAELKIDNIKLALELPNKIWSREDLMSAPLWQIYEGLCTFFENAADNDEYILVAQQNT